MSSRRTRATSITDGELNGLVLKLRALLPDNSSSSNTKVPVSKILKETCSYIKRLQGEVNDLSKRLSHLLASMDNNSVDLEILRSLLQQ